MDRVHVAPKDCLPHHYTKELCCNPAFVSSRRESQTSWNSHLSYLLCAGVILSGGSWLALAYIFRYNLYTKVFYSMTCWHRNWRYPHSPYLSFLFDGYFNLDFNPLCLSFQYYLGFQLFCAACRIFYFIQLLDIFHRNSFTVLWRLIGINLYNKIFDFLHKNKL